MRVEKLQYRFWRPPENSIMHVNTGRFIAPFRKIIHRRTIKLKKANFTFMTLKNSLLLM